MKIALVHSFYSGGTPSGENQTVLAQLKSLSSFGFDVKLISKSTPAGQISIAKKLGLGMNVAFDSGANPSKEIHDFAPDVIHVHNLFPNFSTAWLGSVNVPILSTLHNFRHTCANGVFFRDGRNCFDCLEAKSSYPSFIHGCYRNSRVSTIPLTWKLRSGAVFDPVISNSKKIIVLSSRARKLHIEAGVPEEKICLIPNFISGISPEKSEDTSNSRDWAFVGRLTSEKGIFELAESWPVGQDRLVIYGDGPLTSALQSLGKKNVDLKGFLPHDQVASTLSKCVGLLFPSICSESAVPLVYLEAIQQGLPIIARSGNGAADDVLKAENGLVVDSWNDLEVAMRLVRENWAEYSENSYRRYSQNYTENVWLKKIDTLYKSLIKGN